MDCKGSIFYQRPSGKQRDHQHGVETAISPQRKRAASDGKIAVRCDDHTPAAEDAVGALDGGYFPPGTTVPVEVLDTVFEVIYDHTEG